MTASPKRSRLVSASLGLMTIVFGLASRKFSYLLPVWLAKNTGDALYATLVFWFAGLLFPRLSTLRCALASILFCFGIEFLKLSQFPWLVAARHSHGGALVFGVGFHAQNLICYLIGAAAAALFEKAVLSRC